MFNPDIDDKQLKKLIDEILDDDNHRISGFENIDKYFMERLADKSIKRLLKERNFQRHLEKAPKTLRESPQGSGNYE